ncbi:MAG TPA: hypothetical protein DCY06_10540, partial [Bacteroidetes bacterium]|nr:hypothetical protein [Bacteroidota bacterium]
MKTIKILTLFIFSVFLLNVNSAEADLNYEPKLKLNDSKDRSSEIKKRDLEKAKKFHQQRTGEFFGASVDFQIGYGTTSPSVSERDNQKEINTKGKGGITFGALLN